MAIVYGCSHPGSTVPLAEPMPSESPLPPTPYRIQPGDSLDIKFFYNPELNESLVVRPDDILYVPKSSIARANLFVNQYIEQLLLFRGVSLGFTYEIRGDD